MRPRPRSDSLPIAALLVAVLGVACAPGGAGVEETSIEPPSFACDPDNGGITLPDGFCAAVFADAVGSSRHIAVSDAGDVYVARRPQRRRNDDGDVETVSTGGVLALRDTDGDGRADERLALSEVAGTGLAIHDGHLYYSSTTEVYRVPLIAGETGAAGDAELLVSGFPPQSQHASKPMTFDDAGHMYVTVGGPSNACQETPRTAGSPGLDPCPQLELQGGIWQFDAARPGQTQEADGHRYATGIRNALGIDWNPDAGSLYAMQHGRDSLFDLYGDLYTVEQSAEIPSEEMFRVSDGDDFGWPYCFHDPFTNTKVLAPEYGGDGETQGRCADVAPTVAHFPAHWAPNDLLFYRGGTFPDRYEGGAFVAFHGSWNRMPFPQQGYNIVFVPFADGQPSGDYEVFADGFGGVEEIRNFADIAHRPTGLAQAPDGSLFISSDWRDGRIWRVRAERPAEAPTE